MLQFANVLSAILCLQVRPSHYSGVLSPCFIFSCTTMANIFTYLKLACVASVSSRGSSRKLRQEQKKKWMTGEGEGKEGTRLETLATQANLKCIVSFCYLQLFTWKWTLATIPLNNEKLSLVKTKLPIKISTPITNSHKIIRSEFQILLGSWKKMV